MQACRTLLRAVCALFLCLLPCLFCLGGCKTSVDYFSYVSELRSNLFLAETDSFSLRVYAVEKETPYRADGVARERSARTEIQLVGGDGSNTYHIDVTVRGKTYGGELAYDNVKAVHTLSFPLDIADERALFCVVEKGNSKTECTAKSVRTEGDVSPQTALNNVQAHSPKLFAELTDKYGFAGEIYLRLLYEDAPYYYVGVINRKGEICAFLVNGTTGKVLASRQP